MENKTDILSLSHAELREFMAELGEPKYRADQIYTFLMRGASSFEEINNIPKKLPKHFLFRCVIRTFSIKDTLNNHIHNF